LERSDRQRKQKFGKLKKQASVEEAKESAKKGSRTASEKEETNGKRDGMYKTTKIEGCVCYWCCEEPECEIAEAIAVNDVKGC